MKRQKLLIALLSVLFCFSFIFGIKTAETPKADGIDYVTVEDMIANRDKLLPAFKHPHAERLAISEDGVISSWENGAFHYSEEVDAVAFDITIKSGNELAIYLRTGGDGTLWQATGYAVYVNTASATIYKISNPATWNDTPLGSFAITSFFDGNTHSIKYSLVESAEGLVVTFSIDDLVATGVDTGTPIAKENTEFKMCSVNSTVLYTVSATGTNSGDNEGEGEEEPDGDYVAGKSITDAEMVANKDKLLPAFNHSGAERLSVNNGVISCWEDGHFFYGDEIDCASFNIAISAGTNICFALRTAGGGTMWTSTGYYAYIYQTETGVCAELYKVTDVTNWQTVETQLAKGDIENIFDGENHSVVFQFVPSQSGSTLSLTVGDVVISGTDNGTPIALSGTNFKIARVNTDALYTVGQAVVVEDGEYTVNYVSAEEMMANKDKLLPAFNHGGVERLSVENGVITSWENGYFYYNAEVEAVDVDFSMESLANTDVTFALRAAGDGVMWQTTGYFLYLKGTAAELYKVDNPSAWNANRLAVATIANVFDGNFHNIKYYAVTDTKGYVHLGLIIDGVEAFTAVDRENVLAIEGTELKIASVNVQQVYKVTAPKDTVHAYGEEQTTAPTCTEKGYTSKVCANCGKIEIISEVDSTGHTYESVVTDPTCLEDGYTTYTCACGDTYTEAGAEAVGHKHESEVVAPTCTEKGYTKYTCVCGDTYMEDFVDELGHTFGEWEIVKEATATEDGEKKRTCACGETETEVIPATGEESTPDTESTESTTPNESEGEESTTTSDGGNESTASGCTGSMGGLFGGLALLGFAVSTLRKKLR